MAENMPDTQKNTGDGEDLTIRVNMFGGLSVRIGNMPVVEAPSRSRQVWNLLEYLIAFRHKTISQEEIYSAIWEQNAVENPASALKNLIYRARSVFAGCNIPFAKSIITYSGGAYRWNNAIPCIVDIEGFEELHKRAESQSQPTEYRIDNYLTAISLYKGDFLPDSAGRSWTLPVRGYYRSIYYKCLHQALRLLSEQKRYADIEAACKTAMKIDLYDEETHKHLIWALFKQGLQSKAVEQYRSSSDLYLRKLGVQPPASLRNLYRQAAKPPSGVKTDLSIIQQDLKEAEPGDGAFYCEYEVFKIICQILSRTVLRMGQSIFLTLFTVTDKKGGALDADSLKSAMRDLFKVIQFRTRRCDVFARFSACQFVLLISSVSIENCELVVERIVRIYKKDFDSENTELHATSHPMDADATYTP